MILTKKQMMPTDLEIRRRIEAIGRDFKVGEIKDLPRDSDSEQHRMAFMFQLIVAGRISEVCGPYLIRTEDAFEVKFKGVPAVLFAVRTAKRKGKPRPCAVPLDPKYEPWAQPLLDYFKECDREYPFMFHENIGGTSKRYMMWTARRAFAGLEWPMVEYTKKVSIPYTEDQVLKTRYDDLMYPEYLVELESGKRSWTQSTEYAYDTVKVFDRWKPVTSHVMRKRRSRTLFVDYQFDGFDLAAYGGWTEKSQVDAMPGALKSYLHSDIQSAKENIGLLKKIAIRYFPKLLIPYEEIIKGNV